MCKTIVNKHPSFFIHYTFVEQFTIKKRFNTHLCLTVSRVTSIAVPVEEEA